jgi:AraC-like DNA-binding protein
MTDGLITINKEKWITVSVQTDFPLEYIRTVFSDENNNIWIGSEGKGLLQLYTRRISNITTKEGLPEGSINVIFQSSAGDFWIGTRSKGLCRMKSGKIINIYNIRQGLNTNQVTALWEDSRKQLWIGTADSGLFSLYQNKISSRIAAERLDYQKISAIAHSDANHIWIATSEGLYHYDIITGDLMLSEDTDSLTIFTILPTNGETVYLGTPSGAYLLRGSKLVQLKNTKNYSIISIFKDDTGNVWMGTDGGGLLKTTEDTLKIYTTVQGLPDNYIFSICEDQNGNLWFSSSQGVFSISYSEFDRVPDPEFPYLMVNWLNESNGMSSSRCRYEGHPSVWRTKNGILYYPTSGGITIINPETVLKDSFTFPILLESIEVDGKIPENGGKYRFTGPVNSIDIQFSMPEYKDPEKVRYYYNLNGFDTTWHLSSWPDPRRVSYQNLPAGSYQFRIKSSKSSQFPVNEQILFDMEIQAAFYQSVYFYFGLMLMSGLILSVIIYYQKGVEKRKIREKYKTSTLDPERAQKILVQLNELMQDGKIYLDANLTLSALSKKLRIHPNHLSRIINENYGLNFNDYINKFRIEGIKKILSDSNIKKINMLEIMYDNGFYSKSVFNTAFKKFTGMTPSEFRRRQLSSAKK